MLSFLAEIFVVQEISESQRMGRLDVDRLLL